MNTYVTYKTYCKSWRGVYVLHTLFQSVTNVLGNFLQNSLKYIFVVSSHHLHQHLSGGVLCPDFLVCVWAWWPSGGPSCVCRLCCHLLKMDCWAVAYGTSPYLQEGSKTTRHLVNKGIKEPTPDSEAETAIRKDKAYQSRSAKHCENKGFHHMGKKKAWEKEKKDVNMSPSYSTFSLKSQREPEKLLRNVEFMESIRVYP